MSDQQFAHAVEILAEMLADRRTKGIPLQTES